MPQLPYGSLWAANVFLRERRSAKSRVDHDEARAATTPPLASRKWRLAAAAGFSVMAAALTIATRSVTLYGTTAPSKDGVGIATGFRESTGSGGMRSQPNGEKDLIRQVTVPAVAQLAPGVDGTASPRQLTFEACNEYTCSDPPKFLYPWLADTKLVEPFRDTHLSVSDTLGCSNCRYRWTIRAPDGQTTKLEGQTVTHQFTTLDKNIIKLEEIMPAAKRDSLPLGAGLTTRLHSETVTCKYVRREIRSLSAEDLHNVLDAMHTLWVVDTEMGRKQYGPQYNDIKALSRFYHKGAANYTCDAFNDGLGFPISHVLLTNLFEQSLQLVNPKVALPYWDFTIEAHVIETQYNGIFSRMREASPMFQSNWFGSAANDHVVKDGRWAWSKVLEVSQEDRISGVPANVYGQMRSPWTTNSNPYLVRGMGNNCGDMTMVGLKWPSCLEHYKQLHLADYYDFAYGIQGDAYKSVHDYIGGVNDCDKLFQDMAELVGKGTAAYLRDGEAPRKTLWRAGVWACNGTAPQGTPEYVVMDSFCGCDVAGYDLENDDDVIAVLSALDRDSYNAIKELYRDTLRQVAQLYCKGTINVGDVSHSASPQDPMFWPMHGTMERLLQLKLLSGTLNTSWISRSHKYTDAFGDTMDYEVSSYGDDCEGHRPSDIWPYGIVPDSELNTKIYLNGEYVINKLTNFEATLTLDPAVDALPYIYDHFEWQHCSKEGYDMLDILKAGSSTESGDITKSSGKGGSGIDTAALRPKHGRL